MFYTLIILTLIMGCLSSKSINGLSQGRNAAFEFREMITKVTGHSALDYLGYGCHCGLGGQGKAVDPVDTCCQNHDQCYGNISTYLQFWKLCSPHLIHYSWKFDNNHLICTNQQNTCGYKTCLCDKIAVECFAENIYNNQYKGFNQELC